MNFREKILVDCKQNLELYDYYKSIGCTDNQSLVLSLYTYGNKGYSWRNCSEAFDYFIDKYDSEKDGVFADYIVKLISKVIEQDNKVSLISALEKGLRS